MIGTLAEYLSGRNSTFGEAVRSEIMSTQNAILTGNQYVSDNTQERERTLQVEETGRRIDSIGTGESTSPSHVPHHGSCCCMSCWPKNINGYL